MRERYAIPEFLTANDIKRVRNKLNMSQKDFADFIGSSKPTIERWESGKTKIDGPVVLLLKLIEENTDYVKSITIPNKMYPLRLYYMKNQILCTIIDVNDIERKVEIINYTNNIMFKAFGKIEKPTYEDYEDFLKSRCFPETRDKLKLVLDDLNLPFYDPFMIIQKTEGKMAEDDFWIKIEV